MKFSIIVPTYNEEKSIKQCLSSLTGQSARPAEVLVIDDGSDKTEKIVRDISKKHRFIRYVRGKRKGRAAALNMGTRIAKGDVVGVIDADCIAPSDWIKKAKESFEGGYDAVSGPYLHRKRPFPLEVAGQVVYDFFTRAFSSGKTNQIVGGNFFTLRKIFDKIGFDTKITGGDDYKFSSDLAGMGYRILFDPKISVRHCGEPKSIRQLFLQRMVWGRAAWYICGSGGRLSKATWLRFVYGLLLMASPFVLLLSPFFGAALIALLLLQPAAIFIYGLFNIRKYSFEGVLLSPIISIIRVVSGTIGFFHAMTGGTPKSAHWRK